MTKAILQQHLERVDRSRQRIVRIADALYAVGLVLPADELTQVAGQLLIAKREITLNREREERIRRKFAAADDG